jgi:hypothetical protein
MIDRTYRHLAQDSEEAIAVTSTDETPTGPTEADHERPLSGWGGRA